MNNELRAMKDCRADDEWCADDERRTDDKLRADDEWRDGSGYFTRNAYLSISFFRNIYTSRWKSIYLSRKTYIPLTQNVYTFLLKCMDVFSRAWRAAPQSGRMARERRS